jgi:hypothetical protein
MANITATLTLNMGGSFQRVFWLDGGNPDYLELSASPSDETAATALAIKLNRDILSAIAALPLGTTSLQCTIDTGVL